MFRTAFLALLTALACAAPQARAATVTDATGRSVTVPDHPTRVLPAGPPAAVLLAAIAPDLMMGWPLHPSEAALAFLPDQLGALPTTPRLTFDGAGEAVKDLHPDLVIDYGDVTPRYSDGIRAIQDKSGVPALLLDGHLANAPATIRLVGKLLDRTDRAEALARLAEDLLAAAQAAPKPDKPLRAIYLRSADPPVVAEPGTQSTEVLALAGMTVVAPPLPEDQRRGTFHNATVADLAALDPDVIVFQDDTARPVVAASAEWRALRAVKSGQAIVAPAVPFGWVAEPPSINRLLGLAWLTDHGGPAEGAVISAYLFGRVPDPAALATLRTTLRPIAP